MSLVLHLQGTDDLDAIKSNLQFLRDSYNVPKGGDKTRDIVNADVASGKKFGVSI